MDNWRGFLGFARQDIRAHLFRSDDSKHYWLVEGQFERSSGGCNFYNLEMVRYDANGDEQTRKTALKNGIPGFNGDYVAKEELKNVNALSCKTSKSSAGPEAFPAIDDLLNLLRDKEQLKDASEGNQRVDQSIEIQIKDGEVLIESSKNGADSLILTAPRFIPKSFKVSSSRDQELWFLTGDVDLRTDFHLSYGRYSAVVRILIHCQPFVMRPGQCIDVLMPLERVDK